MFRIGDIVERFKNVPVEGLNGTLTVSSISPSGSHISLNGSIARYSANLFKLIKPVWKSGDTAKILDSYDSSRVGETFIVTEVDQNFVYNRAGAWSFQNLERVALAPAPISPLDLAALQFVENLRPELKTKAEIPTYLYDVVECSARLKEGSVDQIAMAGGWSVNLEVVSNGNTVSLHNIDHISLDAERLRKLAKLCTDLADLMG